MGIKLKKDTFPSGHGPADFKAFGPPAVKDGEFQNAKIADFGCFKQGEVDSNKGYHAAVVQSTKDKRWYAYFEWGRVGATSPSFQFVQCSDEADAQEEFVAQCRSKNDKRGQWTTVAGIRTLEPKPGKDCYLVRPMATRNVGLPDGKTIKLNDGAKQSPALPAPAADKGKKAAPAVPSVKVDHQTLDLMRALNVGTVSYARTNIVGGAIPSQSVIDEARTLLLEATKQVAKIGDNLDAQVGDKSLVQITSILYSRIPKIKPVKAAASTWILSQNNILSWQQDLDTFEAALYVADPNDSQPQNDPFNGMKINMEWIDPKTALGKFIYGWWPQSTGNRHSYLGSMVIRNAWKVGRHEDSGKIEKTQSEFLAEKLSIAERPLYQPSERMDLDTASMKRYRFTASWVS